MKQEIKDLWIDALRSGKYKQGFGRLQTDDCFCAWGVLCELGVEQGIVTKERKGYLFSFGDDCCYYPPKEVKCWAGIEDVFVSIDGLTISMMNDGAMLSFDEIADRLEKATEL